VPEVKRNFRSPYYAGRWVALASSRLWLRELCGSLRLRTPPPLVVGLNLNFNTTLGLAATNSKRGTRKLPGHKI